MNIFYVYHLIDPRNNLPFYVGKGKNERMFDHESAVKNGRIPQNNKFLFRKIKKILSLGLNIQYKKIYENLDEKTSLLREIDEENRLKSLGIKLCNIVPCGTGGNIYTNMSPTKLKQVKEKISKSSTGRIVSDKTREKCRLINLGRVRSEEFKLKVSKSKIGKKLSKETRVKMSESHKGVNFSEEHCKSISDSLKGRKFTDEHKNKLSDVAKRKTGNKNPNYKQLTEESELFILSNIDKPVYWIKNNLKEKVSYNRLKNRITLLKKSNKIWNNVPSIKELTVEPIINLMGFIFYTSIYIDMTKSELKQLIKETMDNMDFNSDNKNSSTVNNFLNSLNDAIVKNPRMVGGKLIVDLTTQTQFITVELILKNIKNK